MKVIFFDVDGVLNSNKIADEWHLKTGKNGWGGFFPEEEKATNENVKWGQDNVNNLKLITETSGAKLVVSSTWRKHFSTKKFKEMFAVYGWIDAPVIDRTPGGYRIRGMEINTWLNDNKEVEDYVIIDDYDDFMVAQRPFFVHTDPEVGLSEEDVKKAIKILK